jgi:hypothetical protein
MIQNQVGQFVAKRTGRAKVTEVKSAETKPDAEKVEPIIPS